MDLELDKKTIYSVQWWALNGGGLPRSQEVDESQVEVGVPAVGKTIKGEATIDKTLPAGKIRRKLQALCATGKVIV